MVSAALPSFTTPLLLSSPLTGLSVVLRVAAIGQSASQSRLIRAYCMLHCLSPQPTATAGAASSSPPISTSTASSPPALLPTVFVSHGGGPSFFLEASSPSDPFIDIGPSSAAFRSLQSLPQQLDLTGSRRPRALLVISAHWESSDGVVHITGRSSYPTLLYDYYGFPEHTYKLHYPAAGDVQLSHRVHQLLQQSGIAATVDTERAGFDHGVFIPLLVAFPAADIPIVQVSLLSSLDAATHLSIGRALSPLRAEGVLIVGSGFITHNFRPTVSPRPFMDRLTHLLTRAEAPDRQRALQQWQSIEGAADAHKRADHLMPLHVAVGAAGNEQGTELAKLFIINQTWCFANYKVTRHTHSDAHSTHTRSQAHSLTHTHTLAHTLTPSVRCGVACNSSGSDERAGDVVRSEQMESERDCGTRWHHVYNIDSSSSAGTGSGVAAIASVASFD